MKKSKSKRYKLIELSSQLRHPTGTLRADKKEKHFKSNVELFSNSVRTYNQHPTWNFNDLKKNHTEVLNKIKLGFGL